MAFIAWLFHPLRRQREAAMERTWTHTVAQSKLTLCVPLWPMPSIDAKIWALLLRVRSKRLFTFLTRRA